jgi:isopropylmalate/homocitrate/citramalate synthase
LRRFQPLIRRARDNGLPVRGYLSTAFWCALEGRIAPEAVVDLTQRLFDLGLDEVSISDTIGKATPEEVAGLLDILLTRVSPIWWMNAACPPPPMRRPVSCVNSKGGRTAAARRLRPGVGV